MSIPRAFLSHSSVDKAFVEQVAENLGREFCVFDKYCFHAGDDLVDSIEKGMARSSLLVLFASAEALKSDWVRLELLQAQKRKLSELTFQALRDLWWKLRADVATRKGLEISRSVS